MPPYPWDSVTQQPAAQQQTPQSQRRRRGTRQLIRENLQTRIAMFLCSVFLSLLFVAGLVVFILWISLRPHRPRFYVTAFSAPGISPGSDIHSSDIIFTLLDRNPNRNIGIFYDFMGGSLFYSDKRIGVTPLLVPFYQPPKNSTTIMGSFGGASLNLSDHLTAGLEADAGRGRLTFRLELSASIRFKVTTWDTHHHAMHVNCAVVVGPDGLALPESFNKRCSIYFG